MQSSVVTHLRYGRPMECLHDPCCKFLVEHNNEIIAKIG